jgi:hypothetical protein
MCQSADLFVYDHFVPTFFGFAVSRGSDKGDAYLFAGEYNRPLT